MKKFLIIIIVLLSILAIGQSIYYKLNKSENESPSINQSEEQDEKLLYILGMSDIYNKYQPKIQFEELEKRFYSFINVNLPEVYKNTYEKNVEEIKQYYEANIEKIKSMYIYNEEEFISIVKQLQNIYNSENEIVNIIDYRIDTNSIMPLQNGLISFETIFSYDNETTLRDNDSLEIDNLDILKNVPNKKGNFIAVDVEVLKDE